MTLSSEAGRKSRASRAKDRTRDRRNEQNAEKSAKGTRQRLPEDMFDLFPDDDDPPGFRTRKRKKKKTRDAFDPLGDSPSDSSYRVHNKHGL